MDKTDRILHYLVHRFSGRLGRTQAVKLLFLTDLECVRATGRRATDLDYTIDPFGPFDRRYFQHRDHLTGSGLVTEEPVSFPPDVEGWLLRDQGGGEPDLGELSGPEREAVRRVADLFGGLTRAGLLDHVYGLAVVKEAMEKGPGTRVPLEAEAGMYEEELDGLTLERIREGEREAEEGRVIPASGVESGIRTRTSCGG